MGIDDKPVWSMTGHHLDLLELGADIDAFFAFGPDIDAPPEPPGTRCPACPVAEDRLTICTEHGCCTDRYDSLHVLRFGVPDRLIHLRSPSDLLVHSPPADLRRGLDVRQANPLLITQLEIAAEKGLSRLPSVLKWSLRARPPPRALRRHPDGHADKENSSWRCRVIPRPPSRASTSPPHNADQRLPFSQRSTAAHRIPRARHLLARRHVRLPRKHKPEIPGPRCIVCCPLPYVGSGWPETCVGVIANFRSAGLAPILVTPRVRKALPESIQVVQTLPFPLSRLPWSMVERQARERLDKSFLPLLRDSDPGRTVAYFWPGSPPHLVQSARERGIVSVREMINTSLGTAKRILDTAYSKWGLTQAAPITAESVELEQKELQLYDYIVAPGPGVEASLRDAGVDEKRVIPASYGWFPARFAQPGRPSLDEKRSLRALFVGLLCVRKGVPELLRAWERSGVDGELVLVGDVEPVLQPLVHSATQTGSVRHFPYTEDIAPFYLNADIFVFPSLEEAGPQVTMEAGGCGIPVIATPMGGGRLVRHEMNGLIVPPGDIEALAVAVRRLADDAELRRRYGARISEDAQKFTYQRVSAERGATMARLLDQRATGRQP